MSLERFYRQLDGHFERTLGEHGPTPLGVDWNSRDAQTRRFDQLAKLLPADRPYSLIDYGSGYGALIGHLRELRHSFSYQGVDRFEPMLAHGREQHAGDGDIRFVDRLEGVEPAEYAVASGLLNLRLEVPDEEWRLYCLDRVDELDSVSSQGFAFNMLTIHSNPEKRRDDLYYGDPTFFFDHCRRRHSKDVALLHDYGLYEFTILVRKTVD